MITISSFENRSVFLEVVDISLSCCVTYCSCQSCLFHFDAKMNAESVLMEFYLQLTELCYLLRYGSQPQISQGLIQSLGKANVDSREVRLFSDSMYRYLLDLILNGPDWLDGISNDVVDGMVQSFDFYVDKSLC